MDLIQNKNIINGEDSQILGLQNQSPAEQLASQDANQLYTLLQQFTNYAQEYLITKNPEDKASMDQLLSKMPVLLTDLSKLSSQLPPTTQAAVGMLSQAIHVLYTPDDDSFTAYLFLFGMQLGQIINAGMGPTDPTQGDEQAVAGADEIFDFDLPEINDNLQDYYHSSGPAKQQYLQGIQSALSSMQSSLSQMNQLDVSPAVKTAIQSLINDLPLSPDQNPNFCSNMIEFTKELGAIYGLVDP